MPVPHDFPSLVEGPIQVVLVAGAGLSAPNAPTRGVLKDKLDEVANNLGVAPNDDFQ